MPCVTILLSNLHERIRDVKEFPKISVIIYQFHRDQTVISSSISQIVTDQCVIFFILEKLSQ